VRARRETALSHTVLVLAVVVALYPAMAILALAVSTPAARPTPMGLPRSFTLANFAEAWTGGRFDSALLSSGFVGVCVVAATLLLTVPAGYALARLRVPFAGVVLGVLLLGVVLPYEGIVIPLYRQMLDWDLVNTWWALILPQIGLSTSLGVFWMHTFFSGLPGALGEAAAIDGASRAQTLLRVYLPSAAPAVATLALLVFLYTWNDFLLALVMIPDAPGVQTAPLALSFFAGNRQAADIGVTAAAAVIVALPLVVLYLFLQRRFISGLLAGAVKE
jgi:raffinose/stachyose/melibiose transport system permease protein